MTISQFFAVLRARKWVALLLFVLTVGTTVGVSMSLTKQYSATASVLLDVKPDPIAGLMMPGVLAPSFVATQVDVIQSDRVAQRVVRNLKLAESPQVREQWQRETGGKGEIQNWLAETFKKNTEVKPSRESNVVAISYRAPDPRFAAALANAFVQAYIETSLELRVDPARQYSSFFDVRVKEARDNLEKAQIKVTTFQRENGIIASDERLDIESARLNELSSQLVMMQAVASESNSRQAQVQGGAGDRMQEVLNNPVISGLKADLSRQEARLQEIGARLGDAHPQVVELKANIGELRSRMEAETRRVTASVGVTGNINRQREGQVRAELEAQRAKVLKMKQVRDEGQLLQRDVENAQRAFDALNQRLIQTNLESQTTQTNAYMLTQAVAPLEPSSPKVLLNTLLSVFVGLLLAIGAAFLFELMDRRVRGPNDVVQALGLPVLGVMPRMTNRKLLASRKTGLLSNKTMARLPASTKGA